MAFVKYSFTFVNIYTIIFNRIHPKIQFKFSKSRNSDIYMSWIKMCKKNENVEILIFGMRRKKSNRIELN